MALYSNGGTVLVGGVLQLNPNIFLNSNNVWIGSQSFTDKITLLGGSGTIWGFDDTAGSMFISPAINNVGLSFYDVVNDTELVGIDWSNGKMNIQKLQLKSASNISSGTGAPSATGATIGDIYFRTDTPNTPNQNIYICTVTGTTWVGIV